MKTPGSLSQYYRDEPTLDGINNITDFPADSHNSISFRFKEKKKKTEQAGKGGTKDAEIMAPLKYLSNFRRTLEMLLINLEIILMLT